MLRSLQVGNYVLIDSLETDFPEGLIIISGATGAGKSILLGALGLLLGAKAEGSMVGPHGENCVVEGVFDWKDDEVLQRILRDNDLEETAPLTIRRVVGRSGRSRSFVNDCPVTLGVLQELSSRLVDVHSQHQTLLLSDAGFRLRALDHFAGHADALKEAAAAWNVLQALEREKEELSGKLARLSEERDYHEARFRRLDEAGLKEGEQEELEQEQMQLAHAEQLKEQLYGAASAFETEDSSLVQRLKEAQRQLEKASAYMPSLEALGARLESARLELEDIEEEISAASSRIDVSQERLETVEQRLSLLYDLMKRFNVRTVSELIAQRDALSEALFDASGLEERLAALDRQIRKARGDYESVAKRLHEGREKACKPFSEAILSQLRFLELDHAVFSVELAPAAEGPSGNDAVRFLFSSTGRQAQDVAKCASGGELSRIMLCLKAMMARYTSMPTLIFDEIDTGVSGSTADKMGRMICDMGADMQVFAITHLPQVAAQGHAHYLVTKQGDVTSVSRLDDEGRVRELARMLSGEVVTNEALANARALLNGR